MVGTTRHWLYRARPGPSGRSGDRCSRAAAAVVLLVWMLPRPAPAADPTAVELAQRASDVHETHCSDVITGRATAAAEAFEALAPVLADLSRAHDSSQDPSLRYWRGMLNQCLGQRERAREDLQAFVDAVGDEAAYAGQVAEARRRLRYLQMGEAGPVTPRLPVGASVAVGAGLFGGAGVFGGLAAWQGNQAARSQLDYEEGMRPWEDTSGLLEEGQRSVERSRALTVGSIGLGVAGAVVVAVSAARSDARVVGVVLPVFGGGVAVALGGRW